MTLASDINRRRSIACVSYRAGAARYVSRNDCWMPGGYRRPAAHSTSATPRPSPRLVMSVQQSGGAGGTSKPLNNVTQFATNHFPLRRQGQAFPEAREECVVSSARTKSMPRVVVWPRLLSCLVLPVLRAYIHSFARREREQVKSFGKATLCPSVRDSSLNPDSVRNENVSHSLSARARCKDLT